MILSTISAFLVIATASASATTNATDSRHLVSIVDYNFYTTPYTGCGVDIRATDISNERVLDPKACADKCFKYSNSLCNAVTWTDYNGGTCWYKQWDYVQVKQPLPPSVAKTGAVSYILGFGGPFGIGYDVDMPGNDIGSEQKPSPKDCLTSCLYDRPNCFAFASNNYQGGTCYYKNKGTTTVPKPGVTSYTVARLDVLSCP